MGRANYSCVLNEGDMLQTVEVGTQNMVGVPRSLSKIQVCCGMHLV